MTNVKLTELCFADTSGSFGLKAKVDRFINSNGSIKFDLSELKLTHTIAVLDGNGNIVTDTDPDTGEEFVVTEQAPYTALVNGILELNITLDWNIGTITQEVISNNSDTLTYIGGIIDANTVNSMRKLTPELIAEDLKKRCNMSGW